MKEKNPDTGRREEMMAFLTEAVPAGLPPPPPPPSLSVMGQAGSKSSFTGSNVSAEISPLTG